MNSEFEKQLIHAGKELIQTCITIVKLHGVEKNHPAYEQDEIFLKAQQALKKFVEPRGWDCCGMSHNKIKNLTEKRYQKLLLPENQS